MNAPMRNGLLAKVHVAKKSLGLDDETYREVVRRATGKRSAGDCSLDELEALLREFERLGFQAIAGKASGAGSRPRAKGKIAAKLRALWISGHRLGIVKDPSEAALAKFVERMTGVAALQWLSAEEGRRAIEGVKAMIGREAGIHWSEDQAADIEAALAARRGGTR